MTKEHARADSSGTQHTGATTRPEAANSVSLPHHAHDARSSDAGFEGDYRPTSQSAPAPIHVRIEPLQTEFLVRLADALNTTLDLQTLLRRTADLIRAVIDYRIFAILLLNDRTNELRMRFQIGHTPEAERLRIRMGRGIVGQAAQTREPVLINDVSKTENYINANPEVRSELAVPLIVKNRVIGVIDIQSEQPNYFLPEHMHLLRLTASRIGQAIENARLYTRVARQAQTLQVLNEISRELTSILDLESLFERIGTLVRRIIDYQMFSIWIVEERDQMLENRYAVRFGERFYPDEKLPLNRGLVSAAIAERRLIHAPDVRKDPRYHMFNPETRSEMIVPLIYKGKVIGIIDIEHTRAHFFNEDHERALTTLSAQIAISIENARLYQRVTQQEQRLESDLAMAREVQLRLLPSVKPKHARAEFSARFLPARTLGGDLYDFIPYDVNRSAIVLGDVSGKASPAALYAAMVSGIMRSEVTAKLSPSEMLKILNDSLLERRVDSQYVTMLFSVWDDENQTLQISNAGSVQPLFCREGEVDTIKAEGFPLALFPDVRYEEFTLSTQPGDSIVFYSDGIADAQSAEGDMFGTERLMAVVKKYQHKPANKMVEAIFHEVGKFQKGNERFDDETVVVLRVL